MLGNFEALFACVAGDKLDLSVCQAVSCKPGEHLMPEQMWVNALRQFGGTCILGNDLLNTARRKLRAPPGLEQVAVIRVGSEVRLEHEPEIFREENISVLGPFALLDEILHVSKSMSSTRMPVNSLTRIAV